MPTRYITGASNAPTKAVAFEYDLGLLLTPETAALRRSTTWHGLAGTLGGYGKTTARGGSVIPTGTRPTDAHPYLAHDNGAYSETRAARGGSYDPVSDWTDWFKAVVTELADRETDTLWFACPDKLDWVKGKDRTSGKDRWFPVGDALTTLEWAGRWIPWMKEEGRKAGWDDLPVAFVAQDGIEHLIDLVPWADIAAVFIGGSDEFKLGSGAEVIAREAKAQGKLVHMGRVSSLTRMQIAERFGCDTADGTFLRFGPEINLPRVMEWLDALNDRAPLPSYAAAKARSGARMAVTNANRKRAKVRSLAGKKAARTRAANKAAGVERKAA